MTVNEKGRARGIPPYNVGTVEAKRFGDLVWASGDRLNVSTPRS